MPVPNDLETRPHFQRLYFVRSGGIKWPALLCSPSSKLEEHVKDDVARCQIFLERQKSQELELQAVALFFGKSCEGTYTKSITNFDHETFDFIVNYNRYKKTKDRDLQVASFFHFRLCSSVFFCNVCVCFCVFLVVVLALVINSGSP